MKNTVFVEINGEKLKLTNIAETMGLCTNFMFVSETLCQDDEKALLYTFSNERYDIQIMERTDGEHYIRIYFVEQDANKVMELFGGKFVAEYFLIDLNEDEYKDYLVRFEGAGYSGSGGDSVYILVGESVGVKEVFTGTIRFTTDNTEYGPFVVLKEKQKGCMILYLHHMIKYLNITIWSNDMSRF